MSEATETISYFDKRMQLLGITPELNKIGLEKNNAEKNIKEIVDLPIFSPVPEGIRILVYTLDRYTINIKGKEIIDQKTGFGKIEGNRWKKEFAIIRLEKPQVKPDGSEMKYRLPKGAGTHPFFPPHLVEKFEKKIAIDTLFCVEGYFKAFKAAMNGVDIIGLSSITHMKEKDTGKLHPDIVKLMLTCKVKRMVWLTDGDAIDITHNELKDGADLSKRPKNFFASVTTFKTLLSDYEDVEKWFFHIDTDSILANNASKLLRDDVKGIDDLLISLPDKTNDIVKDLQSVNAGPYFQKFNVSYSTSKVYNHFHLRDVKDFYLFHVERRPELKDKEFIYNGTRYQYNEESGDCDVKIPGAAKLYFRVGDNYYKFLDLPNQYKKLERVFHERKKSTITDDFGPKFTKYVPKYEAFCNVPDHFNFMQVIHNCFNVYSPVDFAPDEEECFEEDCPTIMSFMYHLFGEKSVSYNDQDTKEKKEYRIIDLALDYLQLLYQQPWQKLPIMCLVSRENNTGKSTFANFLRMMLGANTAIVGNADLVNDFNAHWATKSVVVCDETKIDKQHVIEKIKSLSTAKKIFMNAKGRGQVELDCFIKFVLITNNEDSFIYATDEDIRYWVIKVPVLQRENPHILDQIAEEMPAFLSFLNKRKLMTEHKNRMWFHPQLLKTEALKKVIAYSQPQVEKELRHYLKELFLDTGVDEIWMTTAAIHKEVFKNSSRYEGYYLSRIIRDNLKADTYHVWKVEGLDKEYNTEAEAIAAAEVKYPDAVGYLVNGKLKKLHKVVRHSYPKMEETFTDGKKENKRIEVSDNGRPFIFYRNDFVKEEDNVMVDPDNKFLNAMMPTNGKHHEIDEELPFPIK
jgi:hypothetical protein